MAPTGALLVTMRSSVVTMFPVVKYDAAVTAQSCVEPTHTKLGVIMLQLANDVATS